MRNNALININMANAAASFGAKRYFFSSSGLHLPGYGARRARAHGGASVPGESGQ